MRVSIDFTERELLACLRPLLANRRKAPSLLIADTAWRQCFDELKAHEPEFACVLLGPTGHRAVTHVVPDTTGEGTPTQFRIGARRINEILRQYVPLGLEAKGFAHSHPAGCERLSGGDLEYVRRLFANPRNDISEIHMPIVVGGKFIPYVVRRRNPARAVRAELILF